MNIRDLLVVVVSLVALVNVSSARPAKSAPQAKVQVQAEGLLGTQLEEMNKIRVDQVRLRELRKGITTFDHPDFAKCSKEIARLNRKIIELQYASLSLQDAIGSTFKRDVNAAAWKAALKFLFIWDRIVADNLQNINWKNGLALRKLDMVSGRINNPRAGSAQR